MPSFANKFAKLFGFRIFDSKKGLFVKEPEQSYAKEGTEEKEMNQRQEDTDFFLGDEDAPPEREYEPLEDEDLPFDFGQSM